MLWRFLIPTVLLPLPSYIPFFGECPRPVTDTACCACDRAGAYFKLLIFFYTLGVKKQVPICRALGAAGVFEPDPAALQTAADDILPLFSGSNGRYRLAKRFTRTAPNGILEIASAYENTGIITRQLGDSKPNPIPVLNLVFDGSGHNGNKELLRNFIHYIKSPGKK